MCISSSQLCTKAAVITAAAVLADDALTRPQASLEKHFGELCTTADVRQRRVWANAGADEQEAIKILRIDRQCVATFKQTLRIPSLTDIHRLRIRSLTAKCSTVAGIDL
jgi:hypothetical protein